MANRIEFGGLFVGQPTGDGGDRRPASIRNIDDRPITLEGVERAVAPGQALTCPRGNDRVRWRDGERLDHLFEQACLRFGTNKAVVTDAFSVSYRDLENRANQVARYLIERGVKPGDRVGLLFDKSVETYVALLAVLKANAAYVPLDPGFPTERLRFILTDAAVKTVVSMSCFESKLCDFDVQPFFLDAGKRDIDAKPSRRLGAEEVLPPVDQVCYIIYTSGTTGNPKGVVIEHPSICNFVRVAAELYGFRPGDRVYQGMTIAFDFSIEEIWVPLMAGATLVPGTPGMSLLGEELADFLEDRGVTCMACCPTLLATIERDLPRLRILLVGGEACPHNLVVRWSRPGRTILNSYGPTEATVTATLKTLTPDQPVTIGRPLPTYAIAILDPLADQVVAHGERGEIGIAGIGLAAGYLNRDELTQQKFIPDFLNLPNNPSKRIYRTGDLGRINDDGEIEYLGRIDTQVKIRGYRIELVEIESVLLEMPEVAQAVVSTFEPEPGSPELVAYYALKQGAARPSRNDVAQALRRRLPAYMVPAYLEELPFIPMSASNKADRKQLPQPTGARFQSGEKLIAAKTENERLLAAALAELLSLDNVSTEDHFFDDLGTNSLVMARFCARIRRHPGMSNASMRDIYTNPTIAKLAAHLGQASGEEPAPAAAPEPFHVPSDLAYYGCGALQLAFFAVYGLLGLWLFDLGMSWADAVIDDPIALYSRSAALAVATMAGLTLVPVAAKWLLVGRWTAESFPIWSLRYFRFWVVKTLIGSAPVVALYGTPIYNVYLRLLGARIGRNAVVESRFVPVCTDLVSIGDDTILRKDSILLGYRAQSNFIHTGPVSIGSDAFVGEASVLDIDTAMGDGTQLGHASSLQSGQRIPDGERWHGSPAVKTDADYCPIERLACTSRRQAFYTASQIVGICLVGLPIAIMGLSYWEHHSAGLAAVGVDLAALTSTVLLVSAGLFFGSLAAALVAIRAVPWLCNLFLEPGKTYPLYGFHHSLQRLVAQASNSSLLAVLFGDSSAAVHFMRYIGWNLNTVDQTGSNFGTNQKHDNPFLCDIGSGTMVSDGLSMINLHLSSSSFQLRTTRVGDDNYLGNNIHYPPDGRTGANCLLGTKVMIPIDGPVRENVGLLGSPPFEIPRMVNRDKCLIGALGGEARRQRLRAKNLHNLLTAALFLLSRWSFVFATAMVWELAVLVYPRFGVPSLFAAGLATSWLGVLFFAFVEQASLGFRRLEPRIVTIYDPYFWRHERHWKLSDSVIVKLFAGTPFKNLVSRMVGVDIGRKVYDAGCRVTDRTLTQIGDYANLNEHTCLQAHSLEEGVFKSDHIRMGAGCTLGPGSFVHYGVKLGDHVVIEADSFLMKGEVLDAHTVWRGNPAKLHRRNLVATGDVAPPKEMAEPYPYDLAAE